jgi:hypothetical protein
MSDRVSEGNEPAGFTTESMQVAPQSYLGVFTVESWREFKRHGGAVMGFNEKKAGIAGRLAVGDRILCYLSKVSAFVGWIEVTGKAYRDETPLWTDGLYPVRLPVRVGAELPLANAVPIKSLADRLSFMKGRAVLGGWSIYVRSSPRRWLASDAVAVIAEVEARLLLRVDDAAAQTTTLVAPLSVHERLKFKGTSRVMRVIRKSELLAKEGAARVIGSYDKVLSFNKVTGYSVNVPIAATCRPTATCLQTCYFATGAPSWPNSLRHQAAIYDSIRLDPKAFAERVALEYDQLGLTFLRWNGGGDLFDESIAVINHLARMRPDIVLWVVTRIPQLAAMVEHFDSVYIHFSLDRDSMPRRAQFLKANPRNRNHFFSYQVAPDEVPPKSITKQVSVLFFNNYEPTCDPKELTDVLCPLNVSPNIVGVCETCRRCFNGDGSAHSRAQLALEATRAAHVSGQIHTTGSETA